MEEYLNEISDVVYHEFRDGARGSEERSSFILSSAMSYEIVSAGGRRHEAFADREHAFSACPTWEWWRFDRDREPLLTGPHGMNSVEAGEVLKILEGKTEGSRWQTILCRDSEGMREFVQDTFAEFFRNEIDEKSDRTKFFMARVPSDAESRCDIVSALLIFSRDRFSKETEIEFLCSGVPGHGGKLLDHALGHYKRDHNVEVVIVQPTSHAIKFYRKHGFEGDDDDYTFELRTSD